MVKNSETVEPSEKTDDSIIMFPNLFGDPSSRKVISIYGEINEECATVATMELFMMRGASCSQEDVSGSASPIEAIISTEGGNVQDMFSIYDCMRSIRKDVEIETFGVGKVMSAGILLLSGGTPGKRKIGRNCRLMLHAVAGGHFGSLKELETDIREVRWYQDRLIKSLVEETKLEYKELKSIFRKKTDTYFDAEQAVKWGIADEVV
jgi:ATP-dependent Clp endopeptidase proteolytic subunit ClpP